MPIDPDTVRKMARLARLELDDEEIAALGDELERIVAWVDQLPEAETTKLTSPESGPGEVTELRPDEPGECLERGTVLAGAPQSDGEWFIVPRILPRIPPEEEREH